MMQIMTSSPVLAILKLQHEKVRISVKNKLISKISSYGTRGGEMLPMLVVGWRGSLLRDEEAGCFCEVAGVSIVAAGGPRSR